MVLGAHRGVPAARAALRGTLATVSTLVALVAAAGCTSAAPPTRAHDPAAVGLIAPAGSAAARGAQLAVDLANGLLPEAPATLLAALGGTRRPLTLVVADAGGTGGQAQQAVTRLVTQERVAGIVLAEPAHAVEAAERADSYQVPVVDAASSAVRLNDLGFDWYFRTAPSDRTLAAAALATLVPERRAGPPPRLAVLVAAPAGAEADETVALLRELAAGSGVAHVLTVVTPPGSGELSRAAGELAGAAPDLVVAVAAAPEAARRQLRVVSRAGRQVRLLGLGAGFAGGEAFDDEHPFLLRAAGWSAEFTNRQPVAREVALLYRARFAEPMAEPAAGAFTATLALAAAINTAGTTRAGEVRGALHQLWVPATQTIMPWDGIRFGPGGQNILASGVVEQRTGKTFRVVFPPELAIAPPTLPPLRR